MVLKRPIFRRFLFIGGMLALLPLYNNCQKVKLNRVEKPIFLKSAGSLCTQLPSELDQKTKFLFIIDKSGSNGNTDPGAMLRTDAITRFWMSQRDNANIEWGMMEFRNNAAIPYIADANGVATFSNVQADMQAALTRLQNDPDDGGTPYGAALDAARAAVEADIIAEPQSENFYMIFFVSDGEPSDIDDVNLLKQRVAGVVGLSLGNVFMSTAYYGNNGAVAIDRLQQMATEGLGKYVSFNAGATWDFNDILIKPSVDPYFIKNLLVYNLNAGFCIDGSVGMDSDADGMCDKDEETFAAEGFDPQNRFSFDDGYSDFFHWRTIAFGEFLPPCQDREDKDFDLLTTCEERYLRNQNPPPGIPQRGDNADPDTDMDGFLDGIETFVYFTRSLAFALDPFNIQKNIWDGESDDAGSQIAQHRNPLVRDEDADRYDTKLVLSEVNNLGQSCYAFSQSNLTVYPTLEVKEENTLPGMGHAANTNVVYLHYIQTKQSDPNGHGILMHSFQPLAYDLSNQSPGENAGLRVTDDVFSAYIVPERLDTP